MICKKCNTDFDINTYGTRCPNCNFDNPLQSFDNAADATKYVIDLYGKEILKNGKKFFGIVNDIIPQLVKEKNMFLHIYKENVFSMLYNADGKKDADKKMAMIVSARRLIDNVGLSEQTAIDAIEYITFALNWNIKLDVNSLKNSNTSAVVKNVSATTQFVSKTKKSPNKWSKKKIAVCSVSVILSLSLFGIVLFKNIDKGTNSIETENDKVEYNGEDEQLFEDEDYEEVQAISEEANNEKITYSDTKTYKNSYSGTDKIVSGFEEELTISTKDKKIKFSNGVEFSIISDNSDAEYLRLIYEVYNPTDYPIDFGSDSSLVSIAYNKSNEIVERPYWIYAIIGEGYGDIVFPKSRLLLEVEERFEDLNISHSEFDRIESKVQVGYKYVLPVENISISDVEFSGNYVRYKVKTGEIKDEYVSWRLSFLDKKGDVIAVSDRYYAELFSNTTEFFESDLLFSENDSPIEKTVFYAYYED